ncbi:MAG: hypothetical protein U1F56_05620 [Rubrivivax sp.]
MLPLACPEPSLAPLPAAGPERGYARHEGYAEHFVRVADTWPAAEALPRLALHLDAELDAAEHLALWQALWRCWRRADAPARQRAATALDGRHAGALAGLGRGWDDPALVEHLCRHTAPERRPRAVPVLLAHHGLKPLQAPADCTPPIVLHAAWAAVAAPGRLDADAIGAVQAAVLDATGRDPSLLPQGPALLFELALHAHDEATAAAALAEALTQHAGAALRAERVCAWLDGSAVVDEAAAAMPLQLAPPLQRRWLALARWGDRRWLAALQAALVRPAPRARLQALAGHLPDPTGDMPAAAPEPAVLGALARLDQAWAAAARGQDPRPPLAGRLHKGVLAPVTLSALHRARARQAAAAGDVESQAVALMQARKHHATPDLRAELAALLPGAPFPLGPDWRVERPHWERLLTHADARWPRVAMRTLALLDTEGQLEPRPPRRQAQRLHEAHARWQQLLAHPAHAAAARHALQQPEQVLLRPAFHRHGDDGFLWFETPGATRVWVVFSCVATHHAFAEVTALHGRLPGHHLLFVRCPEKNWYTDAAFERVRAILADHVAARFEPDAVSCWYGSMGGHGAWKFALEFGWRAIVFNPQTDLDLWAAFRPRERALLWDAQGHRQLVDWPLHAWERVPLYLACGAATADRAAFSVALARLRQCRHLDAIVEKFDDPEHAGLMNRITGGEPAPALLRIEHRLQALARGPAPAGTACAAAAAQRVWDDLDAARSAKIEVQVRDGRLWWRPSQASGTRAA